MTLRTVGGDPFVDELFDQLKIGTRPRRPGGVDDAAPDPGREPCLAAKLTEVMERTGESLLHRVEPALRATGYRLGDAQIAVEVVAIETLELFRRGGQRRENSFGSHLVHGG
jgi:hypothetical protein